MNAGTRVVCAVIRRGPYILAAQRAEWKVRGGCWELPGGKVESGETDFQAIRREMMEELDMNVNPIRVLGTIDHRYADFHIELVAVACEASGVIEPGEDHQAVTWVDMRRAEGLPWSEADRKLLVSMGILG
jgi:8-oxo-dGTP diphosphatase